MEFSLETEKRPNDEHIQKQLSKAAAHFGIAHDIQASLNGHSTQLKKHASGDEDFPVRNREEAAAAQRFLLKYAGTDRISDLNSHLLADKIVSWLGTEAAPELLKMAGFGGVSDIKAFAEAVGGRTSLGTVISVQNMDEVNSMLPNIIKTAAIMGSAKQPWKAIQHSSRLVKIGSDYYSEDQLQKMSKVHYEAICGEQPFYECDRITLLQEKLANAAEAKYHVLKQAVGEPIVAEKKSGRLNLVAAVLLDAIQSAVQPSGTVPAA
jgi:hypothetical protein